VEKVFFLKDFGKFADVAKKLLKGFYTNSSGVLIKIHFGEQGNKTALFPRDVKPVVDVLGDWGLKSTFIDTPVAYSSLRNTAKGYESVVKERGYDKLSSFIISDNYVNIK